MHEPLAAARGQVTRSAAEIYEAFFVPALFDQWSGRLLDTARVSRGDAVLDVGCGTGTLARAAALRVRRSGSVTGVDINDGMLTVARRGSHTVTWRRGAAESLPFPDRSFDRVVSQFALMFFADPVAALTEMVRVTRPGGTVTIATWADLARNPGYAAMVDLLQHLVGDDAAAALGAPFGLGTTGDLQALIGQVLPDVTVSVHRGRACFDSLGAWIHTEIRGWTLADMLTDTQYARLLATARSELAHFVDDAGRVQFPVHAIIASAPAPGDAQRE